MIQPMQEHATRQDILVDHSSSPIEYLQGVIERVTYHAETSGYTIARMKVSGERELVTITGTFPAIQPGQTLRLTGAWREHPKYGQQFQVAHSQELKPATLTGIEKYLGSGLIKGIGPATARRIVAYFGTETLAIIESDSHRLIEVPSIGPKRIKRIQIAWEAQKIIKEVMLYLQTHGVTPTYATKIYKQYGQESIAIVSENPYRLAADIYGIGFVTADTIARNVGFAPDSEPRYRAGIVYVLNTAAEDGHCFLPQAELAQRVTKQLALPDFPVDPARIESLIMQLAASAELIIQPGFGDLANTPICYTPPFYHTEVSLAERLRALLQRSVEVDAERVRKWIDGYTQKMGMTLFEQQRQSVEMAAAKRILILTGSIPVVRLTEVFRQAATSAIITNAHRINQGQLPVLTPVTQHFTSDCLWVEAEDPEEGAAAIKGLVTQIIPKHGLDVLNDVQVLCPGTRSPVGTRNLNTVLQQSLNPASATKAEIQHGGRIFRVEDHVIQLVNDYTREIFNGDMGVIKRVDLEEQELQIQFGERTVIVDQADLNEMTLAWAVTVHKSQGSEYPAIILPLFMPHYTLLTRNLFYTGLPRAKKLAIIVGPVKALRMTVMRVMDRQRYTALAERMEFQHITCRARRCAKDPNTIAVPFLFE